MINRLPEYKKLFVFAGLALLILATTLFFYHNLQNASLNDARLKTAGVELVVLPILALMLAGMLIIFHGNAKDPISVLEKKLTEQTIETGNSEKKYRYLFQYSPMPMWVMDNDSLQFLDVNEKAVIHYGYSREEFLSMTVKDIIQEKDKPFFLQTDAFESLPYDNSRKLLNHVKKNGSVIQVKISGHRISFENKNASLILASDVSEKAETESKLISREKRFQALTENNNEIITLLDDSFKVFYRSPSSTRVTGWYDDEIMVSDGKNKLLIHPDDREMSEKLMKECLENPAKPIYARYRNLHKQGHYLWLEGSVTNLLQDENVGGIVFNFRDITPRMNAENKLLSVEKRFRVLTDKSNDIISLVDETMKFNYRSPSASRITGWSDEEVKELGLQTFIHPDEMEVTLGIVDKLLSNPGISIGILSRFLQKNGNYIWMEGTVTNLLHDEHVKSIVFNTRDVSERIASKAILQRSEERFRALIENSNDIILLIDAGLTIIYNSPSTYRITGWSDEDMKNTNGMDNIHPEDREYAGRIVQQLFAKPGKEIKLEFRSRHKTGHYMWIEGTAINLLADEKVNAIVLNYRDITSRKDAELKIITNEKRFRKLLENGEDGFAIFDAEGQPLYISSSIEKVLGFTEMEASRLGLFSQTHPDDLAEFKKTFALVLQNPGVPYTCRQVRVLHKDGNWHWLEQTMTNMMDDADIGGIVNNFRDVTAKVNSEKALMASEEQYRTLVEQASDGIFIADMSGRFIMVNSSCCKMSGFTLAEVKEKTIYDLIEPASMVTNPVDFAPMMKPEGRRIERKIISKDGTILDVEISAKLLSDNTFIAFVRDITERLATQKAIKESEEKYRVLVEEASEGIFITDRTGCFITVNTSACKISQYSEPELLKMNIYDFFVAEDIQKNPLRFDLLREGKTVVSERYLKRKDGQLNFIEITSKLLTDGRLLSIVRDVTERKKAQEALIMSEEKYRSLVEQASDGIFIATSEGNFSVINSSACKMSGYTEAELQGFTIYDLVDPEGLASQPFKFEEMMLPQGARSERQMVRKDGSLLDIELSAKFLSDKRFIAFVRDISERKKSEQAVRISNERYNLVSKATNHAIWEHDILSGSTIRTGDGFKSLFGYENDMDNEDPQASISLIHPEDLPAVLKSKEIIYQTPEAHYWEHEYRFLKACGEYAYVYDKGYVIRDVQGKAVRMIGAIQDITNLKENEINLRKLNKHLQKQTKALTVINAELEQFAYVASHDLQEPLRMVTSFLTLIEQKYGNAIDDNGRKYIGFAVDGAKRMRQIILDLLEFSRAGKNAGNMQRIDLSKLLQGINMLFDKQIEEKQATLTIGAMPVIYNFETPLQQVFQNLIGNALKYCHNNIPAKITVTSKELEDQWQFSVADNGIGISEVYFDKIFIIFQRLHNKNDFSGTGIGLAITKKIVENLGGEIWVESIPNKGSTFFFTIKKVKQVT